MKISNIPDTQRNVALLWGIPESDFQDCFWQSVPIVSRNAKLHKEIILKATAAASAPVSKF
jgi:hypothetical protein